MTQPANSSSRIWHTDDLLVRIARGDDAGSVNDTATTETWGENKAVADAQFGVATLSLLAGDPERQERMAALRNKTFPDRDVVVFGARTKSQWALEALAGRFTGHAHDWASLRASIIAVAESGRTDDPVVSPLSLEQLTGLTDLLHERDLDAEAEKALLQVTAAGVIGGGAIHKNHLEPLAERLLQNDLPDLARAVLPRLPKRNWVRHAITAELEHPRFGGSFASVLRLLNEPYHRVGIEAVSLSDGEGSAFARLAAAPAAPVTDGPLVTIIMTTSAPGPEIFVAVRSLIAQSYQNWELIITDDASPRGIATTLKQLSALDSRIRVIRNDESAGVFVRRNEALQGATGEFVALQDPAAWAHPRRLEIQVQHLMTNPGRMANVVNAARVTDELSLLGGAGADLIVDETSLMFRREDVLASVGFFDSVPRDADLEFRRRLERATGVAAPVLLPGAPLEYILTDSASIPEGDPGVSLWNRSDRLMYLSGAKRYLQRIEEEGSSPRVAFPLDQRPFAAPAQWSGAGSEAQAFDVVVVLDGRDFSKLRDFHATVVAELEQAVAAGLRVAVLQAHSLPGPRGRAYFAPALQDLVDAGAVTRIVETDAVSAGVVVVRHAGAAQGHRAERLPITTSRAVVIEDASANDSRGDTFARPDVSDTVTAWFGVEPSWDVAAPPLPPVSVSTVTYGDGRLEMTIETGVPRSVREVRLTSEAETVVLDVTVAGGDSVLCQTETAKLAGHEWTIEVEYDAGAGRTTTQECPLTLTTTIMNRPSEVALRTESGGLLFLPARPEGDVPGSREFASSYLSASADRVAVAGEQFQVRLASGGSAAVSRIYALRKVNAGVVRRRDFTLGTAADGSKVWERPLAKFADSRWYLYGTFRTPQGLVEYPVALDETATVVGGAAWAPQILSGGRLLIAPPRPGRVARATSRVTRVVSSKFGDVSGIVKRRGAVAEAPVEKVHFNASHAEPRVQSAPTVTVVMPVYNVEPYLDVAISSVLDQEFADLELILVDDASTDNGRRIIQKYWQADPRVRVFGLDHNTIGGAGVPSNIGIRAARGEYVAFADSDDHVTPQGLARMVRLAEQHEAELVIGDFKTFSDKLQEGAESYDRKVWADLPLNKPISAFTDPALFKLSPVPWRKLYRRSFLQKNAIAYPEGDYFYEDNPLHWFVLSRAHTVVMCDEVISYHRMEREGQTMSAATYKLGAFVNHMNTIRSFLTTSTDEKRNVLFEAFYDYLARTNWVAKNQTQPAANELIRRGMDEVYQRARTAAPDAAVAPNLRARLASYSGAYPDIDLTIIVPVFNSADLLKQTMDSVLGLSGLRFNVILVDDGSTDDSLAIMEEYEKANGNVHVFAQGNRGAGRARNSVIPLATGRYTFFLDADDVIDPEALVAAVAKADEDNADLLFVEYKIEYTDEGRTDGMYKADREVWRKLRASSRHKQRQQIVAQLINYPWNRIIRTSLLHDANIFFGATVVNNDVPYHWQSIVAAQSIGYLDAAVVTHRKFATRDQVTNIQDGRRMAVLEALRSTHERISTQEAYENVRSEWEKFALHLLAWAKDRIPDSLHANYEERRAELTRAFAQG
ncbi:glycosyltransferase [Microbacterium gorillae]|uniref:glycosyltransferase n=1 Tax=Microbacterium gorillae TaxID=1231063 RepID=UPI00069393D4|nr:glycosyltransferase [Microbacterium gorillae]